MTYSDYKVDVHEGTSGPWSVRRFVVSEQDEKAERMRALFGSGRGRFIPVGSYTGLYRSGSVIMSDTPDEVRDHLWFIRVASGRVLIAGLGLGLVLQAVARKPGVERVTVVEKSPDVIALVRDHYLRGPLGPKVEVIEADIFDWRPARGERYAAAWFDIWDNLCTDNLAEMGRLHRRFTRHADRYGSWGKELLLDRRRREQAQDRAWGR